jgi:hypothetical protein
MAMIMRSLVYFISLPERLLRATASLIGGTVLVFLETLIPVGLQGTTLYRILIGDGLRFIVERIAGIPTVGIAALPGDYQRRKLVGSAIEGLGLIAVQFSPLWVFAIAADAAAGSQVFLRRLAAQLKLQGVIDGETRINDLTDLLDVLQKASRTTVSLIDAPPLARAELEQLAADLRQSYTRVFQDTSDLLPRFESVWQQMNEIAASPGLSMMQLSRFMSLEARGWGRKGRGVARSVGATSAELFGKQVLEGYQRTLDELKHQGTRAFLRARWKPYLHTARAQFIPGSLSWTERQLLGLP